MDSGTNHHHLNQEEKEKINETVVSAEQEVNSKSKIEEKETENTTITGEGDGDPTADDVDVMIDIDGDDLIFCDDAFFACLSSPTASSASNLHKNPSISTSSSSAWSFLAVSGQPQGHHMHSSDVMVPTPSKEAATITETDMIFGDIELWDPSNPLDPSFLFPDDYNNAVHDPLPPRCCDPSTIATKEDNGDNNLSDELAKIFLEWLKSNRDSISPEDLRSIKLKKSTIECAAARLGGGKQGWTQLLKLILAWVQNHHLQKKKRRLSRHETESTETTAPFYNHSQSSSPPPAYPHYQFPFLSDAAGTNPNPSLDYNCCEPSWTMHYPVENPIRVSALPCISEAQVYQSAPVAPYHYYQSANTSSIVVNGQPFSPSPSPDFGHVFCPPPMHFSPLAGGPGLHPIPQYSRGYKNSQYSIYPNPPTLTGAASATKEARKKRMARQRRFSALHHHRSRRIHNNQHSISTAAVAAAVEKAKLRAVTVSEGGSSSAAHNNNNNSKNWAFWSSARQKSLPTDAPAGSAPLPAKSSNMQQPRAQSRNASSSDKRKGLKSEKNLRVLLQKVLKQSDVGSLGRIVLPKKEAEIHLPELDARDGISIPMEDICTSRIWNMKYRFWPNNKSRMYVLENTGDFVRSNGLQEGDLIVIYSDVKCNKYMIRGVKARQQLEPKGAGGSRLDAAKAYQLKKNSSDLVQSSSNTSRNEAAACYDSENDENENNVVELPCYIEEDKDDASP